MKAQLATLITLLVAGTAMAQDEQGNRPPPRGEGGFIKHFDKDGDGKISQDEFKGPAEHFSHMDKNGDGFISEEEAPKGPPPKRGQGGPQGDGEPDEGFIKHFDQDGDGQVSQDEFKGPDEHFTHMDKNGDGYIDASEAPKGPPPNGDGGNSGDRCPPPNQ